jgi:hypothetical protein
VLAEAAADQAAEWLGECYGAEPEGIWHAPVRAGRPGVGQCRAVAITTGATAMTAFSPLDSLSGTRSG